MRHFRLQNDKETVGYYRGNTPRQAAVKAFGQLAKETKTNKPVNFSIVECTQGCKHKVFNYVGQRVKLDEPVNVQIGGSTVSYQFKNKIKRI